MFPPPLPSFTQPPPIPHRFHLADLGCHLSTFHHRVKVHHDFSLLVFTPAVLSHLFFGSVYLSSPLHSVTYPGWLLSLFGSTCTGQVSSVFATLWTVAHQAPLSMGFSRQEYWSGVAMPSSRGSSPPRNQTCVF